MVKLVFGAVEISAIKKKVQDCLAVHAVLRCVVDVLNYIGQFQLCKVFLSGVSLINLNSHKPADFIRFLDGQAPMLVIHLQNVCKPV